MVSENQSLILQAINNCSDFDSLTKQEKEEMLPACKLVRFKKEEDVFAIQHEKKYFFIVLYGRQSLQLRKRKGYFGPGDLFGEIVLFSQEGRMGTIHCEEDSTLVAINKEFIQRNSVLTENLRVKLLLILGGKMAGYLYRDAPPPIVELLKMEESYELEFKQSYSKKLKAEIQNTVVAFMNTKGGSLLIGVSDDKKVVGVKLKNSKNAFKDDFCNSIKSLTSKVAGDYMNVDIDEVDGKVVIRIIVQPSNRPMVFKGGVRKNGLYVRHDGQTSFLEKLDDIINYCKKRF